MRRGWLVIAATASVLVGVRSGNAQDVSSEIRDSQIRLEQVRQEREQLQRDLEGLRERVRDASAELATIARMRAASATALQELDYQASVISENIEITTARLAETRSRLEQRTAALHERLRWIYKQGPLHTFQVLLSARDFTDFLHRLKYLQLITLYDRALVRDVALLERELVRQDEVLKESLTLLEMLRAERLNEDAELARIEAERQRALSAAREQERSLADRLEQLARDEARIGNLIVSLEAQRREAEQRARVAGAPLPAAGSISTRSLGSLRWPVEGQVIYRFGPEVRPNGVRLRWNGIGIAAPVGTPVTAVESGTVVMAAPLEGYGPSVVLNHGDGYYTLYLHLAGISVREGQRVEVGDQVGTVGGDRTPEGPHIEFRVHAPGPGGSPIPVDPLSWLQSRAGSSW